MILDGPNTIDLAVGNDRRIVEEGDSQLSLPPVLIPVLLQSRVHNTRQAGSGTFQNSGVMVDVSINQAPSTAANNLALVTLVPGLWELEMTLTTLFDYTTTPTLASYSSIEMGYQGQTVPLVRRMAFIGSFVDYNRCRFLLNSQATLTMHVGTTIAAQNSFTSISLNMVRVL